MLVNNNFDNTLALSECNMRPTVERLRNLKLPKQKKKRQNITPHMITNNV